jgi:hypothetical protein
MNEVVHLFRGAPYVRSWSKYQTTVEGWTLCGIARKAAGSGLIAGQLCVEDSSLVSCPYCLDLMGFSRAEIRAIRAKLKRALSPAQKAALDKARAGAAQRRRLQTEIDRQGVGGC